MDATSNLFDAPDAVQDILSPPDNHNDGYLNPNIFGLNLSRSQSAAPMFSGLSSSVSPPRSGRLPSQPLASGVASIRSESFGEVGRGKKSYSIDAGGGGLGGGASFLFGGPATTTNRSRRHFFSEDEDANNEEEEDAIMMPGLIRRPASTGGIDRNHSADNDRDVNSILETLGLTSLDSTDDIGVTGGNRVAGSGSAAPKKLFAGDSMIRHEGEHVPKSSKASKYFTSDVNDDEDEIAASQTHFRAYNGNDYGGLNNGASRFSAGGAQQQNRVHPQFAQPQQQPQPQQQHPLAVPYDSQQQQQQFTSSFYDSQQQMFYSQQPTPQYLTQQHTPQLHNLNLMPTPQPTLYQINSPNSQPVVHQNFGYDFQQQQQQQQQTQQQSHILLQQSGGAPNMYSPHHQPQFVSIVPIQTSHHHPPVLNGHSAYAFVQYGLDGTMQLHHSQPTTMANPATATFIMGPHGQPVALASIPMNAASMGYPNASGTSPPDGGMVGLGGAIPNLGSPRTPSRGGGMKSERGPRTPSGSTPSSMEGRGKMRGNGNALSSPRGGGKRGEKNVVVPSRMGPVAASLLNEIRAAKSRNQWTVHDIAGHIIEFCLDQNGSRFIQQRLEVADDFEKKAVMDEVVPSIKELQNDVFGNYVIQKLFEFGNADMKRDLKDTLKGNMLLLSLQMYGCRVIQKALESLAYDDLCELLQEFDQNILVCIQDQNGNHVMQKCIEVISMKAKEAEFRSGQVGLSVTMAQRIQFIVDDVLANVESLCCHPYGCRVLQRMLEHCVDFQKLATLDEIQLCHKTLLDDQYGNYVIQHVLQYGRDSDRDSLLKIIVDNDLLKLSRQKFASNVVEKLLKYGNSYQRNAIVREMLKVVYDDASNQEGIGSTVLLLMVRDAYANYVVQTAIDVAPEGNEKRMLIDELKSNEGHLRNYTFAKHIVAKLGAK
eukprot:CCRYP_011207-RB/>CCRYP_011207-RB protein AED:0.07 eAED:0.07 QI:304/1/1/1/1/1/6/286/934